MSAAPRFPAPLDYAGLRMTADEYLSLGETRDRYELIDGVVIMSPSPIQRRQRVAHLLAHQIEQHADAGIGLVVTPDIDVRLSERRVCQPDLVVFRLERAPDQSGVISIPPDLVIEVLSPGSGAMDLITKRQDYEQFGVGEYWVVDPDPVSAKAWRRKGVRFLEPEVVSGVIECATIPGLSIDLGRVRQTIDRRFPE